MLNKKNGNITIGKIKCMRHGEIAFIKIFKMEQVMGS